MSAEDDVQTECVRAGAAAARDLERFYEAHGDELSPQNVENARRREAELLSRALELLRLRADRSPSVVAAEVERGGISGGPNATGLILFARAIRSVAETGSVGRYV